MFSNEIAHEVLLSIPGQGFVSPRVREVLAKAPLLDHRSETFKRLFLDTTGNLKKLLKTTNGTLILTGSGTSGIDATLINVISPGDKVLAITNGEFGDRLAEFADKNYRANVHTLSFNWGELADPEKVRQVLEANPDVKAVLIVHCETSTGVTNPLDEIGKIVHATNALFIIDAVSSTPAIDLETDNWNCDIVITASQKGWGAFPGLTMLSISNKAWDAIDRKVGSGNPLPASLNLSLYRNSARRNETPFTPATQLITALNAAMYVIQGEGHDKFLIRHKRAARMVRDAVRRIGLTLLVEDDRYASSTVTTVLTERADVIIRAARQDALELAGGLGILEGKALRIGHLGSFNDDDIQKSLLILEKAVVTLP